MGVGEVLSVDSVTRQDGGVYVCTADNGAGSKSRDFDVDIHCTSSGHFTVQKLQSFSYCIFSRIYAVLVK